MSDRKIRGLEDRESQERKALLRDVRSPVQQIADALKNGTVQTSGTFWKTTTYSAGVTRLHLHLDAQNLGRDAAPAK